MTTDYCSECGADSAFVQCKCGQKAMDEQKECKRCMQFIGEVDDLEAQNRNLMEALDKAHSTIAELQTGMCNQAVTIRLLTKERLKE